MAEVIVQGQPVDPTAAKAAEEAKKVADKNAKDKADRDADAEKKISEHRAKLFSEAKGNKMIPQPQKAKEGTSPQDILHQKAALLADAIGAKTGRGPVEAWPEAFRLATGEHEGSEWERGHYAQYNRDVLAERDAVVVTKDDTLEPSLADAAGRRVPAPGITPGGPGSTGGTASPSGGNVSGTGTGTR